MEHRVPIRGLTANALAVLAASALAVAVSQSPARQATGSLRGVVLDQQGRSLNRARIAAHGPSGLVRGITGEDGRFEIRDIIAGSYHVIASKTGYVTSPFRGRRVLSTGELVEVVAGRATEAIELRLPRAAVIAGRVLDQYGEPLVNARVYAERRSYEAGLRFVPAYGAATDDRGDFRIHGLPAGRYLVSVVAWELPWSQAGVVPESGGIQPGWGRTYYPGVTDATSATLVTIHSDEASTSVDFTVLPVPVCRVSGQVLDSAGNPAAGRLDVTISEVGDRVANTITFSRNVGQFEIRGLPPGDYLLTARGPGGPSGGAEAGAVRLFLDGGGVSGVTLRMAKETRITGHVVVDGKKMPDLGRLRVVTLSEVRAGLTSGDGPLLTRAAGRTWVNSEGTGALSVTSAGAVERSGAFQIEGLLGRHCLRVVGLPPGWMIKGIFRSGRDITDVPFDLYGGEQVGDVEVVLTDRITSVTGRVIDDGCLATRDCVVVIFAVAASRWSQGERALQASLLEADGRFRIERLAPGEYLAVAVDLPAFGQLVDPELLERLRPVATRIIVSETTTADVVLPCWREARIQ